jgi:hypothetical protein
MRQIERASKERRTFFGVRVPFGDGRRHDRKGDCVMTAQEMRTNAHQCLSWSESSNYQNREAFFALARAWMSAAIRLERDNTPLETPLLAAPPRAAA